MKVSHKQLPQRLRAGLAPVYLIAGDEPLLVGEALSAVRKAARRVGFEERDLHVVERGFHWEELEDSARTLSLFCARRIVELRMTAPKPGDAGARALRRLAEAPDPDRLLLIGVGARLDASTAKAVWVKTLEAAGVLVEISPPERSQLPAWVTERAATYHLRLGPDAAEALAERVEGNLLAADQELRKLALTAAGQEIDVATVLDAVSTSARFDVFLLTDAVTAGDAPRAMRVLAGLEAEGVEPVLVSWALVRELGSLAKLKYAVQAGERLETAFARNGIWRRRQGPMAKALKRYEWDELKALLGLAAETDAAIKGASGVRTRPWDAVGRLVLAMLGGTRVAGLA